MAGHPEDDAQWATNAAFASPGDSWDTDPTKVRPPAGLKAEGWEPTLVHPAGFENYLRNKVGEFVEYLRLVQVKNWRLHVAVATNDLEAIGYDDSTRTYMVTGDTGAATTLRSLNGGETWVLPSTPPAANDYLTIAADGAGNWVLGGNTDDIFESGDDGDTWTLRTLTGAAASEIVTEVIFEPVSALWVATVGDTAGGLDGKIYTSGDRITWTRRVTLFSNAFEAIAIDGLGRAVAITTSGRFVTSSDMITWVADSTFSADTFENIAFSAGLGLWMITGNDVSLATTLIATSTDGVTFNQVLGGSPPAEVSLFFLANDGGSIWLAARSIANGQVLWVSTDAGLNWTELTGAGGIRDLENGLGSRIFNLRFFARKFWATDQLGGVWESLAL